jgi:SAM-dependent methyltransferase
MEAVWHDVECASYTADLDLWRELAEAAGGPVLDLGCGTGRVALDLAERGHDVTGVDSEPALVRALAARARERGLRVHAEVADARSLALGARFALAIAPMQVAQLLGGEQGRAAMLAAARMHLQRGGLLAVALADPFEGIPADDALPPLPDVREENGWVYSSMPVAVRDEDSATAIDRLRQTVSPDGEFTEAMFTIRLDHVHADDLEAEAQDAGFRVLPRRSVPPTEDYVGSAVVMLEAA